MKKFLLWIIGNAILLFVIPILYYIYLDRLIDNEYARGVRTSTSGDSVLIPVFGVFILLFLTSVVINLAIAFCMFWKRQKHTVDKIL